MANLEDVVNILQELLEAVKEQPSNIASEVEEVRESPEQTAPSYESARDNIVSGPGFADRIRQAAGSAGNAAMQAGNRFYNATSSALQQETLGRINDRYSYVKTGAANYIGRIAASHRAAGSPLSEDRIRLMLGGAERRRSMEYEEMRRVKSIAGNQDSAILRALGIGDWAREAGDFISDMFGDGGNMKEMIQKLRQEMSQNKVDLYKFKKRSYLTNESTESKYFNDDS